MIGRLMRGITEDGLRLEAMVAPPEAARRGTGVLYVHGSAGRFYSPSFVIALGAQLTAAGYTFLAANNRGHDVATTAGRMGPNGTVDPVPIGSYRDTFTDCIYDIRCWLDELERLGCPRLAIFAHSFGCAKSVYYLGETGDARVQALVIASPGDGVGRRMLEDPERLRRDLARAEALVAAGRGDVEGPESRAHFPMSARTFLTFYSPDSKAAVFNFFGRQSDYSFSHYRRLPIPILATYGTVAEPVPTDRIPHALDLLQRQALASPRVDTRVFEGSNHWYTNYEDALAGAVTSWLREVLPA